MMMSSLRKRRVKRTRRPARRHEVSKREHYFVRSFVLLLLLLLWIGQKQSKAKQTKRMEFEFSLNGVVSIFEKRARIRVQGGKKAKKISRYRESLTYLANCFQLSFSFLNVVFLAFFFPLFCSSFPNRVCSVHRKHSTTGEVFLFVIR